MGIHFDPRDHHGLSVGQPLATVQEWPVFMRQFHVSDSARRFVKGHHSKNVSQIARTWIIRLHALTCLRPHAFAFDEDLATIEPGSQFPAVIAENAFPCLAGFQGSQFVRPVAIGDETAFQGDIEIVLNATAEDTLAVKNVC